MQYHPMKQRSSWSWRKSLKYVWCRLLDQNTLANWLFKWCDIFPL